MVQPSPWLPKRLLLLFVCLSENLLLRADTSSDLCSELQCLNDSPCRLASDGSMTSATCLCPQGWVGHRCQGQLHITASSVTMTTVTLHAYTSVPKVQHPGLYSLETDGHPKLDLSERTKRGIFRTEAVQSFKYSIHYWLKDRATLCNIIPQVAETTVTIAGLQNDTEYTFCAKSHPDVWCDFELDLVRNIKDVAYCVHVRTRATPLPPEPLPVPSFYIILVVCLASFSFIALLIIVIVSIRNDYFSAMICAKSSSPKSSLGHRTQMDGSKRSGPESEFWPLTTPDGMPNTAITVRPPSCPGKPPNSLVQNRKRGYASFSAKNEHTIALTTVIEYTTPEDSVLDEWDEDETTDTMETILTGSLHASLGTFGSVPGLNTYNEADEKD